MPALPLATIPHPLGSLSPEQVRHHAEAVLAEVVHILTTPRHQLNKEYRGQSPESKGVFRPKSLFT